VEESLFIFLDIVAQGNSFSTVAYGWDHDLELTQGYVDERKLFALYRDRD